MNLEPKIDFFFLSFCWTTENEMEFFDAISIKWSTESLTAYQHFEVDAFCR